MSKVIHEEEQQQQGAAGGAQDKIRKVARQLAYDVRYKVKQGFKDGQKADPNSLKRAYMQQLGKSPAPGPVKALAKKMLIGEEYDFFTIESSLSSVVGKVFTTEEEVVEEVVVSDEPSYLQNLDEGEERKYQVRVKDKKTGKSYVRTATRAKIAELRANPNISSVEMTGYGKDYAAPTDGGGKKAKKDYDGDGKVESGTAEYMGSRDKAIKKAMAKEEVEQVDENRAAMGRINKEYHRKKESEAMAARSRDPKVKRDLPKRKNDNPMYDPKSAGSSRVKDFKFTSTEEFIGEVNVEDENPDANDKKIDMMKGKNKITINPKEGTIVSHNELEGKVISEMDQEPAKEDPGLKAKEKKAEMAKKMVLQKKLQAVRQGAGNEIMASHEVEGDMVEALGDVTKGATTPKKDEGDDDRGALQKITMVRNKLRARGMQVAGSPRASDGPRNMKTGPEMNQEGEEVKESNVERAIKMNLADRGVQEEMSMDRRKRAAEIGAKSSSYKTRFAAMKLASGENKPVRGSGNKAAKRAAAMNSEGYGMEGAPSIKDAKPAKKTSVKDDKKLGVMAPQVKEATYPSDFRNPDGSKRAVAKKKTDRPIQHDQPTSGGRRKTIDE